MSLSSLRGGAVVCCGPFLGRRWALAHDQQLCLSDGGGMARPRGPVVSKRVEGCCAPSGLSVARGVMLMLRVCLHVREQSPVPKL